MILNEELLSDRRFAQSSAQHRSEIITFNRTGIEERIGTAAFRLEAEQEGAEVCLQFETECSSMQVRRAFIRKMEEVINNYWERNNEKGGI